MIIKNALYLNNKGLFTALLAFAFLCLGDACLKRASLPYDSTYAALFTNLFCIATLLVMSVFNGGPKNFIITRSPKVQILRGFIMVGVYLTFIYCLPRMQIAQLYTIVFTQPFFLALLAHLLIREKIGIHRILAICVGFAGVIIAMRPGVEAMNVAALLALLCAFLFASANIAIKFIHKDDHWMTYIFYTMAVQTPILAALTFYQHDNTIALPALIDTPWMFGAGFSYAVGLALLPIAMKLTAASTVGAVQYSGLIWGSLLGFILFKEIPDAWTVAGGAVIVASGLYLLYREHKSTDEPHVS